MEALQGLKEMVTVTELDDFLQCPVCYEVPAGHIYQCNEGHHVCVTCKRRLDRCPVCRAMFFGTRNYALEELIANIRKMKLSKSEAAEQPQRSGASGSGTPSTVSTDSTPASTNTERSGTSESRPPPVMCAGLFRCLCCISGRTERLPVARMLNHLRYWHTLNLIEGKLDGEHYEQAWQIPMNSGRIVLAVRVVELGIFFLVVEIQCATHPMELHSWLSMVATPLEADNFYYNLTFTASDREATFADTVMSVRSCEGQLKKRHRCLTLDHANVPAFRESRFVGVRLCVWRATERRDEPPEPRAVVRIASRSDGDAHQPRPAQPQPQSNAAAETVVARLANASPDADSAEARLSRHARRRLRRRLARVALPPPAARPAAAPSAASQVAPPARNRPANPRR